MTISVLNHRTWLTFFIILILSLGKLTAQLSAKFSASAVAGCAPVLVQFTDQSTGNPTQWHWELGNGVTSVLQNPSTTYFNPGTYNIKLIIRTASGKDSLVKNNFITVYPNPEVNFLASDTSGCIPLPVQFKDISTTSGGTISKWNWDFGDGAVSNLADPSHVYNATGTFTVTLKVTNIFGCFKTFNKSQYIKASKGVTADFTNSNPSQCKLPVTINFTNTSAAPTSSYYVWDFGDGSQSNAINPTHIYTRTGAFTVSLIAISPQGCRDTIKKVNHINISDIKSDFTIFGNTCVGQSFTLINTTTPKPNSVLWDFGDGTTSTLKNPNKTYNNNKTYTIKLINNFGSCSDSTSKNILVYPKTKPSFSCDQTVSCKAPFTVQFINSTPGNNTYKWIFGDGTSSTELQPTHTYNSEGQFTVSLVAINENGCSDTLTKQQFIQIQKPAIIISDLQKTGCIPIMVNPVATITSNEPVVGYQWDFGDGATSTAVNPKHVYNAAGNYNITLSVITSSGCADSVAIVNAVRAGDKPKAKFTTYPSEACAANPINFTGNSTGNVDEWLWQFGDSLSSSEQNPSHVFNGIGKFSASLIAWSNTCADTATIEDVVNIKPPLSSFAFNNNCINKYKVDFTDSSKGATSWFWDFGDRTTSTERNPSHTYAAKGSYKVTLTVTNGTCTNSSWRLVKVIDEKATFIADKKTICKGNWISFSGLNINTSNIAIWNWDFGDSSSAASPTAVAVTHTYRKAGEYTVSLTITDSLGCVDTKSMSISVYGPTANFKPSVSAACLNNSTISFKDSSSTNGSTSIVKWIWNYGDGTIDTTNVSRLQYTYTKTAEYTVALTVVDNYGCSDYIVKPRAVIIAQPKADFNSPDTVSCIGKPIRLFNQSGIYDPQYQWTFGDGTNLAGTNPIHNYNMVGLYTVSLTITDKYGCKDSMAKTNYINISLPKASFTVSDSVGTCPPLLVKFTNTSVKYISLKWDFDDGSTSTLVNPSHYYTIAGVYYPKLIVTGPGGCTDTISKRIEVRGPKGTFSYKEQIGCKSLKVNFTASAINYSSITWDYSDGIMLSAKDAVTSHTYSSAGEYVPKIILTDGNGCSVSVEGKSIIRVVDIEARFTFDKPNFCNSGNVSFGNATVSNDLITEYGWSFGDGSVSSNRTPSHRYNSPGLYTAQLIATTQTGCKDTAIVKNAITVYEGPVIKVIGDTAACAPAKLTFNGTIIKGNTQALQWNWNFGNGQVITLQNPPAQVYNDAGDYNITSVVTDEHGCKDSVSKTIKIRPVPNTRAGQNALVCRGNTIQLNATGAATYMWKAAPSLSCTNCANPIASPTDSITYLVTGFSQFGCSKTDSVSIRVRQPFTLNVGPGDSICEGNAVHLWASGADKYTWSPSSGLDNTHTAKPIARPSATTLYNVVAKDNDNCFTQTANVMVKVNPLPSVEAGADVTMAAGSKVQLKTITSSDVTSWKWLPDNYLSCTDCSAPMASPRQAIKYYVTVKNKNGCASTDNVTVSVICNNGNLFIPNTFSPNGDGRNERFYPRGTGIAMIRSLRIYNRWGEIVFEKMNFNANSPSEGWDGTYKGQKLISETYMYLCEVVCTNNEVLTFTGDVTLLR